MTEHTTRSRVLVVDDHPDVARRLGDMVSRAGFHAALAFSGTEALAAVRAAQSDGSPFSVVITDLTMTDLDGLAVAESVKSTSPLTGVILITTYRIDAEDDWPRHVDAVLSKSLSDGDLRSTLARLTGRL